MFQMQIIPYLDCPRFLGGLHARQSPLSRLTAYPGSVALGPLGCIASPFSDTYNGRTLIRRTSAKLSHQKSAAGQAFLALNHVCVTALFPTGYNGFAGTH